jgi:two-component system, NarL family, sensor histidine kinase UhpB
MKRGRDSLSSQIVAANLLLVMLTIGGTLLAAELSRTHRPWELLLVAMAIALSLAVNLLMLQRRFRPLEAVIDQIETIDPSDPSRFEPRPSPVAEIDRLSRAFKRLLSRIEEERREAGQLVVRAQEQERRRLARDLHDEVNQALTAILLRLEALAQDLPPTEAETVAELKRLVDRAMEELLSLGRQLRPSALDDHGLLPALTAQVKRFARHTGVEASVVTDGKWEGLDEDKQATIYRVGQEALSNVIQHANASRVEVRLAAQNGGAALIVEDDGEGFDASGTDHGGLGLGGMTERARLVGGELDIRSSPGTGTTVRLTIP